MGNPKPMTQKDLDAIDETAGHGDHGPLVLSSRCHIAKGTWLEYKKGVLTARCRQCDAFICEIAVAP